MRNEIYNGNNKGYVSRSAKGINNRILRHILIIPTLTRLLERFLTYFPLLTLPPSQTNTGLDTKRTIGYQIPDKTALSQFATAPSVPKTVPITAKTIT